jgi:hypothetical protein
MLVNIRQRTADASSTERRVAPVTALRTAAEAGPEASSTAADGVA